MPYVKVSVNVYRQLASRDEVHYTRRDGEVLPPQINEHQSAQDGAFPGELEAMIYCPVRSIFLNASSSLNIWPSHRI